MRNSLLTTIFLNSMLAASLSPVEAQGLLRREANKSEHTLTVVRSASTQERHRWKGPLDCSLHPFSRDIRRAEAVLIVVPEEKIDAVPHWNVCRVRQVLKSGDEQSPRRGDQVIVENLPTEAHSESYLIFCRQALRDGIESLEFQCLSEAAERFVTSLSQIKSDEKLIEFLFAQAPNTDKCVLDETLAELSAIPYETFQKHANALPDNLIRRCALSTGPNQTTEKCQTAWKMICLHLLPLVALPADVTILEKLVYQSSGPENELRSMYLDTFVAMADPEQLQSLSRDFIRPERTGADEPEKLSDLYKAYCALRNHRNRTVVAKVWHQSSKKIVATNHLMADLVLEDYRRISDWRFVDRAIRILNENQPSEILPKACLKYVLQAQRDAIQSHNRELADKTGRFLKSYEQVNPDAVNEAQELLKLFSQSPDAQSSR